MSQDMNSWSGVGRLTRDAELKYTQGGTAVVNASIAIGRRDKHGEQWVDAVSFFDVTYFGKGAEAVHKYLIKGKQIAINGELRQERWDQDGKTHSKVKILAYSVQLLGDKPGASASQPANVYEDDVPF